MLILLYFCILVEYMLMTNRSELSKAKQQAYDQTLAIHRRNILLALPDLWKKVEEANATHVALFVR